MNQFLYGVARAVIETFELPELIVEIGAYQVAGQEQLADLRALLPGREYLGIDMRPGPGVDLVADVENLPHADGTVGTVISFNTFEHVRRFWRGFDEIQRVLRPDGAFVVACPFHFHLHDYPHDYWRFTPAALEMLLEPYPSKIIGWHGAHKRPAGVWAVAFRERHAPIAPQEYARYRQLVAHYAREPELYWTRRWRYRLASLLCGRGPFAVHLDREKWESRCLLDRAQAGAPCSRGSAAGSPAPLCGTNREARPLGNIG